MHKRGQGFSINTIVMIVVGLVAVVIVILLFRQQITTGSGQYEQISQGTGLEADRCFNLIEGRSCAENCPEGYESVGGSWKDCDRGEQCCKKST